MLDYFRRFCQFIPEKHAQKSTTHWDMMNDQTFFMIQIEFFSCPGRPVRAIFKRQHSRANIAISPKWFCSYS